MSEDRFDEIRQKWDDFGHMLRSAQAADKVVEVSARGAEHNAAKFLRGAPGDVAFLINEVDMFDTFLAGAGLLETWRKAQAERWARDAAREGGGR